MKASLLCAIIGLTLLFAGLTAATDIMTVEADIIDTGTPDDPNGTRISIQVPDFIDLGEVDEDGISDEPKIYMNNTGEVSITVTPQLIDYTDDVFENLYFRELKTSGGVAVTPRRIGEWSMNISAPASGSTFRSKYFYMQLDLSDSDVDVSSNLIGHRANVKFVATPQ